MQLTNNSAVIAAQRLPSGGYSASQLTSLLSGSSSKLTADSSTNAAGILQYCVKNKVLSATSATSVKDQLMSKLGVQNDTTTQKADYQDGINGILHTGSGQSLDLNSLGAGTGGLTQIKEKVKTKACNVVLKQSKSLL